MEYMLMPFRRFAEFNGRSRRKEYWMFMLFLIIVGIAVGLIEAILGLDPILLGLYGPLSALLLLVTLIPGIAVGVRRLHDTNRSGWWLLLAYGPYALLVFTLITGSTGLMTIASAATLVGCIVLLVFLVSNGTPGANSYGPDPKNPSADPEVFA